MTSTLKQERSCIYLYEYEKFKKDIDVPIELF